MTRFARCVHDVVVEVVDMPMPFYGHILTMKDIYHPDWWAMCHHCPDEIQVGDPIHYLAEWIGPADPNIDYPEHWHVDRPVPTLPLEVEPDEPSDPPSAPEPPEQGGD